MPVGHGAVKVGHNFTEKNIIHDIMSTVLSSLKLSPKCPQTCLPWKWYWQPHRKGAELRMTWNFCRLSFLKYFLLTFYLGSVSFCSKWPSTTRCLSSQLPNVRRNNNVLQTRLQLRSPFWLFLPSNSFRPQNQQKGRNNDQADSVHAVRHRKHKL